MAPPAPRGRSPHSPDRALSDRPGLALLLERVACAAPGIMRLWGVRTGELGTSRMLEKHHSLQSHMQLSSPVAILAQENSTPAVQNTQARRPTPRILQNHSGAQS